MALFKRGEDVVLPRGSTLTIQLQDAVHFEKPGAPSPQAASRRRANRRLRRLPVPNCDPVLLQLRRNQAERLHLALPMPAK